MDLMDLGLEYLERAVHLRNQAKELENLNPSNEYQRREISRRRVSLCIDAQECTRIGQLLISYYRKE